MKNNLGELIGGLVGTSTSAVGTALQTNEVLQTISLIITILGGIVSLIVIPILTWYKNAKKDGKITKEEIDEGLNTLQEGVKGVKEIVDKNKKEGETNE